MTRDDLSSSPAAQVAVFTRIPKAGSSKTRLIPALGAQGAADLQRAMTEHVVSQVSLAAVLPLGDDWRRSITSCVVRSTGGDPGEAARWLGVDAVDQGDGDLGMRMQRALEDSLRSNDVAAVIGGDCPTVSASTINMALRAALDGGAAIVPAADGGYCMLALRREMGDRLEEFFRDIEWGTSVVCSTTVQRLRMCGVEPVVLDVHRDIDEPEDLAVWDALRDSWEGPVSTISVVIPTLDEADALPATLEAVGTSPSVEVIVVDGGSSDETCSIAEAAGATVVRGVRGRAVQMNEGARLAVGDALVFLHADTLLPLGWADEVRRTLSERPTVGLPLLLGAFTFEIDTVTPTLAMIRFLTRIRGRFAHLPYGDQAIFCRRSVFSALGGFPDIPLMEDYEFVDRCRRAGGVRVVNARATTSARRWVDAGALRWTLLNIATTWRYRRGVSPAELLGWRRSVLGHHHSKR